MLLDGSSGEGTGENSLKETAREGMRIVKQFVTEDSFWELFPEARIGVVVAHDMRNADEVKEEDW